MYCLTRHIKFLRESVCSPKTWPWGSETPQCLYWPYLAHDPPLVSHDIQRHPDIYYFQILRHRQHRDRETGEKAIPKRGGVEITTAAPHTHTSNPALFETTPAMWFYLLLNGGLNFRGLYHIVLWRTRLQSEAREWGQREREGICIYLVCGLMAPYVCEKKWQAEVGSERRPTPPPNSPTSLTPTVRLTPPPLDTCFKPASS